MAARAAVEALLRERKLDRTLTSTLPERLGEDAVAALDSAALDRALAGRAGRQDDAAAGGLPRGQVSEVVGPASSGRTSVAWAALAAATRRGESVALIDTFDRFDPPTAHACGIDLPRLLWVRGQAIPKTSSNNAVAIDPAWLPGGRAVNSGINGPATFVERVIDRAIKSLNLVVQSGVCTMVVIDLIDVPANALRRLPASTWFRVERAIEGSDTAVLILAAQPVARSAGGRSIILDGAREPGTRSGNRQNSADPRSPNPDPRSPIPDLRSPIPDLRSPIPDLRSPIPDPRSRIPGPVWKGDHDRSRRVSGVRLRAQVNAARSMHARSVELETIVQNAL